ncbi:bifunctional protein FolD 1, mitochondrial-like [Impatiens glandulifera]|uniref:bifunctional protein FolD 1, mitochondrial-like n=1 Tax=Impatiens glandulifera TaxID=253017 RepID=UPI001FB1002C|nr:bifunctional protein FolD 1, mitochondrial-like [Impatiens glandulifera]
MIAMLRWKAERSVGGLFKKWTLNPNSSVRRFRNNSSRSENHRRHHIIRSPPLLSLDILDAWPANSTHYDPSPSPSSAHCNDKWTARLIDGKSMAEKIQAEIASEVTNMKESIRKVPGLAVILVGERKDSLAYVRNKRIACEEAGIRFVLKELPVSCTEDEVTDALLCFNKDSSIHGILVQLPLPMHLNEEKILNELSLEKDVDGFHPLNIGNLAMIGREPLFIPCTPKGCIELLIRSGVEISGKKAVVIGRSNIVGLPTSLLLQRHHATVSTIHAITDNPEEITRQADILVSAVGVPNLVRGSWLKPGAVVIDVGTFPIKDPNNINGYRLMGDVCMEEAVLVASAITPVPGGVGPMTIAMLLSNTLDAAKRSYNFH